MGGPAGKRSAALQPVACVRCSCSSRAAATTHALAHVAARAPAFWSKSYASIDADRLSGALHVEVIECPCAPAFSMRCHSSGQRGAGDARAGQRFTNRELAAKPGGAAPLPRRAPMVVDSVAAAEMLRSRTISARWS